MRRIYTQGLTFQTDKDVSAEYQRYIHSGSFEVKDRGMMDADQVMSIVRFLPVPVKSDSRPHVCPPCVGFSEPGVCGNVCRIENGKYVILPGGTDLLDAMESREACIEEVEAWVRWSKFKEA